MTRFFNVTGFCNPNLHYMVDIKDNIMQIKKLIDAGAYFTINRARQYGKTTTLKALKKYIQEEYVVASIDFQFLSRACFRSEDAFVKSFSKELLPAVERMPVAKKIEQNLKELIEIPPEQSNLNDLFSVLSLWCKVSSKPVVLLIDEADRYYRGLSRRAVRCRVEDMEREEIPRRRRAADRGLSGLLRIKERVYADL